MISTSIGYLGPYRLLNVVFSGRTSLVWQAYHDGIKQFFALKTLISDSLRDRQEVAYLKWEHKVASPLEEHHLIRIHEFSANRGTPFLTIEWFGFPNMKQRIRTGFDTYGQVVPRILIEATEALAELHKHGWVHRDIKPDNFLVADDGEVKLIDFALAQRPKKGLAKLFARKSKVQGTKSYMSPEQIRGRAVDARSDLYSLACTFFELIAGTPPFTGVSAHDLLLKHVKSSPPSLRAVDKNVTEEMADLIRVAMAKQPENRPHSAEDFLAQLKALRPFHKAPQPQESD